MNQELYNYYIINRTHRAARTPLCENIGEIFSASQLSDRERVCRRFEGMCAGQRVRILPFEKIVLSRTDSGLSDCFTKDEWAKIKKEHYVHELGYVSNLSPDYGRVIASGLLAVREGADSYGKRSIDALISLCDRYLEEAKKQGREDLVSVFEQVPRYGARNFREALQFFRILHFALWLEGDYHNTVGRFDQYIYPYFKADMEAGFYTEAEALELLEDFFISFNKDSDLYVGVQQGDNGQSMVLGGTDKDGNYLFNELSRLCLLASEELKLIDPKINLRVNKSTPIEIYELGTRLTRAGLGFPQYSNDDVVIPGLIGLGYSEEDAYNYAIAACWEFIIPGVGDDIANIGALNFPKVADEAIRSMDENASMDALLASVKNRIADNCNTIMQGIDKVYFAPSPMMDLLRDGKKYQNFGIHGSGVACAADALAAVEKFVLENKTVTKAELLRALDENFANDPSLYHMLRYESPKMGAEDGERAAELGCLLLSYFADALEGKKNCLGGIWRAGTGTAMYYLWHADEVGATADGRRKGEPYGTNFSPSLIAKIDSPISVVEAFAKPELSRVINGGPLTLEFASSIFSSEESIAKVASLVRYYISLGGHQLQLNAVNLEHMKDAQAHPELYGQLVVRIWGWSAYFVELDKCFQDHVMARQEYCV